MVNYNKLWKLMIDKGYNKTQLCEQGKISTNAMAKMGRNEEVRLEVLRRNWLRYADVLQHIWVGREYRHNINRHQEFV